MKAYKVFNSEWACRDFQYEIGKTYKYEGEIKLCESGFHACMKLIDCFRYYDFDPENKVAEVEMGGEIIHGDDKSVCSEITIVKELSWGEVLDLVNTGKGNTGIRNSGKWNSGNCNSGNWNSGDWNSGISNSGNRNSGSGNSGNRNTGNWNSGYKNGGDRNSGNRNTGNWNSGEHNSGGGNSGHYNFGDRNTGSWNSCDEETGFFNTQASNIIKVFNKPLERSVWENTQKPQFIYNVIVFHDDGEEIPYKEAWAIAWEEASDKDKELLEKLPNFDWEVFTEITGIRKGE